MLCSVGDTFSDITDSVGLDAEAQSLGAATISAGCMAQVWLLMSLFLAVYTAALSSSPPGVKAVHNDNSDLHIR